MGRHPSQWMRTWHDTPFLRGCDNFVGVGVDIIIDIAWPGDILVARIPDPPCSLFL